jgi:hypothetical protein
VTLEHGSVVLIPAVVTGGPSASGLYVLNRASRRELRAVLFDRVMGPGEPGAARTLRYPVQVPGDEVVLPGPGDARWAADLAGLESDHGCELVLPDQGLDAFGDPPVCAEQIGGTP